MDPELRIALATPDDRDALLALVAKIEVEDHPDDPRIANHAPEAAARSLESNDILDSNSAWCLLAIAGRQAVGWALLVRVPKLDDRLGFLFLDELHVLEPWRRQGVGQALLERSIALSRELGLAGVRLLARTANAPARALYEACGFERHQSLLYQFVLDRENAES